MNESIKKDENLETPKEVDTNSKGELDMNALDDVSGGAWTPSSYNPNYSYKAPK